MNSDWNILGPAGLQFFGEITATTTHELNNAIGIINENAGLLEDLGGMAKQGTQPDIDRWIKICQKITAQVQRTHKTINTLNNFAHSADRSMARINPDSLLSLIISLSTSILAEKNVTAHFMPTQKPMEIYTCPFLFLHLMGNCLVYARDHVTQDRKIIIRTRKDNGKSLISFSGIWNEQIPGEKERTFPEKSDQELMNQLDATMEFQTDQNSLIISMDTDKTAKENNG